MTRKIIGKKTITFYEGDEDLLDMIETAAKNDRRSFTSFVLKTLTDKIGQTNEDEVKVESDVPISSKAELKGW